MSELSKVLPDELSADLVLLNGKIITVDPEDSISQAVAVKDNKIIMVGEDEEVKRTAGRKSKVIDLEGRAVLPGLMDVHLHMINAGLSSLREFRIPRTSIKDVLEVIRRKATEIPEGEWLRGGNIRFSHVMFAEKRFPTRWELDEAAPNHLVFIHLGPHIKVVNSKVLELAKITKDTPDPLGGTIVKDPDTGEPTGVLRETASHLVTKFWPPYTYEDRLEAIRLEGRRCLEEGVTTVHDIVVRPEEISAYMELHAKGELPIRVRLLVRVWESHIDLDTLLKIVLESKIGDGWLKIAGIKMSLGGGISGSNAALYEEYSDEPGNFGVIRIPYDKLVEMITQANENGIQCAVHALGNRDLDLVIHAFEAALNKSPRRGLRHRVEHAGNWMFTPWRRRKFRELDLIAVPNINFLYTFGDGVLVTLGPERTSNHIFPLKTMKEEGMMLTSGSDGPNLEPAAPLRDVGTAVVRKTELGVDMDSSEAVSVMDAIRMFTINAAYLEFEEGEKGSIEPGKIADMAVLSEDPLTVSHEMLKEIKVDMTIIDRKVPYTRISE
jgi:predicted amidohydrolase YtcJ